MILITGTVIIVLAATVEIVTLGDVIAKDVILEDVTAKTVILEDVEDLEDVILGLLIVLYFDKLFNYF